VTYNQGWREVCLPSRDSSAVGVSRPPLALNLHYLLVAYGDAEYVPQMLLGLGMQALHETPFLTQGEITSVFTAPPPLSSVDTALATADLADQVEMIKVTPQPLSTDDLSKLWTAFGGKFRPSAGYEATVVLIESTAPIQSALPVLTPNLLVLQFSDPTITSVAPVYVPWASTPPTLTLTGTNLTGQGMAVVFENNPTSPQSPQPVGNGTTQVTVTMPTLPAGINAVQVMQQMTVGAAPAKNIVQSNVSLFYLQPVIRQGSSPPNDDLITVGAVDTSQTPPVTPITVELDPVLDPTQQVQLLLNQVNSSAGAEPPAFTFNADPSQISGNSVTFSTFGVPSGSYLVRVRVDGAASALRTDPTTNAYAYPVVNL
jgi:Pvc16 N-terminal domain